MAMQIVSADNFRSWYCHRLLSTCLTPRSSHIFCKLGNVLRCGKSLWISGVLPVAWVTKSCGRGWGRCVCVYVCMCLNKQEGMNILHLMFHELYSSFRSDFCYLFMSKQVRTVYRFWPVPGFSSSVAILILKTSQCSFLCYCHITKCTYWVYFCIASVSIAKTAVTGPW